MHQAAPNLPTQIMRHPGHQAAPQHEGQHHHKPHQIAQELHLEGVKFMRKLPHDGIQQREQQARYSDEPHAAQHRIARCRRALVHDCSVKKRSSVALNSWAAS